MTRAAIHSRSTGAAGWCAGWCAVLGCQWRAVNRRARAATFDPWSRSILRSRMRNLRKRATATPRRKSPNCPATVWAARAGGPLSKLCGATRQRSSIERLLGPAQLLSSMKGGRSPRLRAAGLPTGVWAAVPPTGASAAGRRWHPTCRCHEDVIQPSAAAARTHRCRCRAIRTHRPSTRHSRAASPSSTHRPTPACARRVSHASRVRHASGAAQWATHSGRWRSGRRARRRRSARRRGPSTRSSLQSSRCPAWCSRSLCAAARSGRT
mmetsp:Transcript_53981/g.160041  ORF Transcript_53981/g.160041 Transcript_53981/m.160041 type:complete len:267 (+) Transcript_53981:763-1563(+)